MFSMARILIFYENHGIRIKKMNRISVQAAVNKVGPALVAQYQPLIDNFWDYCLAASYVPASITV